MAPRKAAMSLAAAFLLLATSVAATGRALQEDVAAAPAPEPAPCAAAAPAPLADVTVDSGAALRIAPNDCETMNMLCINFVSGFECDTGTYMGLTAAQLGQCFGFPCLDLCKAIKIVDLNGYTYNCERAKQQCLYKQG